MSFVLALGVGLTGLTLIFSLRSAVETQMKIKSQEILSADLSLSARRIFSESEREEIEETLKSHKYHSVFSLFTMATSKDGLSKLIHLKAIPKGYPFYGHIEISENRPLDTLAADSPFIFGDASFLSQLQVQNQDLIQIGEASFLVKGQILEDPSQSFRFSALAPKAYVSKENFMKTNLLGFGSTVSETFFVYEPDPTALENLRKTLKQKIQDTSIRIETANEAAQSSVRALKYLSDYLGLISLVGFFLSALGAGFIFFETLKGQLRTYSIYQSLGLSRFRSLQFLSLQILILSFLASALALLLSFPLFTLISKILLTEFQLDLSFSLQFLQIFGLFGLAFLSAMIVSTPHLVALFKAPMNRLMDSTLSSELSGKWKILLPSLTLFSLFLFSFYLSRSFKLALFFTMGLSAILALIGGLGFGFTSFLGRLQLRSWAKVALEELNAKKTTHLILISVVTLSLLLIDMVKQIEHSLQSQLTVEKESETPRYFLFDIQEDQVVDLKILFENKSVNLLQLSPMVRAKMISINAKPYEVSLEENRFETREQEEEARFRNRGLNLSYRVELYPGEEITAGAELNSSYKDGDPLELSVEEDYARRVDLSLGDSVEMDVQGLPIQGVVKNLRRVSWTTFLPNFFIITQPGLLETAPKTWLAGVSRGPDDEVQLILRKMNQHFPNISFVDLDQVIRKIKEITGQMSQALFLTALLVFVAGAFILLSLSRFHFLQSRKDLNLLKVLGADSSFLARKWGLEQVITAAICLTLSLSGSAILSHLILDRVFEVPLNWSPVTPLGLTLGMIFLSFVITGVVLRWSRSTTPKDWL